MSFAEIEKICPGYRLEPITTMRGYERCVALQIQIWNYTDRADVVPVALLALTPLIGGILLGAYDARRRMVGFVYGFPALHGGRLVQHSDMLGVLKPHRNRNLGLALKLAQRQCALEQGMQKIVWTFDPLQALNAHFNFNDLGVYVDTYEVNLYGRSSSALHRGLDTDRFLASWPLKSAAVKRKVRLALQGRSESRARPDLPVVNEVRWNSRGRPESGPLRKLDEPRFLFEIPANINHLKAAQPPAAARFQRQMRAVCLDYFARGYRISAFFAETESDRRRCFYLFGAA